MKIQWIGLISEIENKITGIEYSEFESPKSLDSFDLTIIDLTNENIWRSVYSSKDRLRYDNELNLIQRMISHSKKTIVLVVLPQNEIYTYSNGTYKIELKLMLDDFHNHLRKIVKTPFSEVEFEPTQSEINGCKVSADFYFLNGSTKLTESLFSEKITTTSNLEGSVYFTSLNLNEIEDINIFLEEIGLYERYVEVVPEWMGGIEMFDDDEQRETIQLAEQKIKEEQAKIDVSNGILEQNKKFKSILYTQSDELVDVVFEMMEEMLGINLASFVDNRKEDIGFEIDGEYFIGEIKGISDNVKAGRLSQLDNHLYHFLEKNEDISESNVRRLLIVNHQRKKVLEERDSIDKNQIDLAINKYGSLIIETTELLKLFEKFRSGQVTREEVINLFKETGKLTLI